MIFIMTLLALFSFSSLTQQWIFIKTTIVESILLVAVVTCLFRPDFVMDKIYPKFLTLELDKFVAGKATATPGYSVRFHVVRSTDYGDRYKLFRVATPDMNIPEPEYRYGLKLEPAGDDRYEVINMDAKGLAGQAGIKIGDYVTEVDVEKVGQPPKELIYPVGLALIGVILGLQWMRQRRQQPVSAAGGKK